MLRVVLCSLNARYSHTGLAVRSLSAWLRQHGKAAKIIVLERSINDPLLALLAQLAQAKADVYAFSAYIWNIGLVRSLSRELKKLAPAATIVWGGPEAGSHGAAVLTSDAQVDYVIAGEGEQSFDQLLCYLADRKNRQAGSRPESEDSFDPVCGERTRDLSRIGGLIWRDDESGRVRVNPSRLLDPDAWPFPYTEQELALDRDRILYYESSRGCPFRCAYCLSALDPAVRFRSLPLVLHELDLMIRAGAGLVKFVDRTFNCRPERALQIWRYLIDRHRSEGFTTRFHFEVAGDLLDDAAITLLLQAPPGLIQLEIGIQSAHKDVLAAVDRHSDLDRLASQLRRLGGSGPVSLHLDLIAGLPGESLERFADSFDFVWQLHPRDFQLGFLKILPGTPMETLARLRGYLWLDEPPYEVLQSDCIDFTGFVLLKQIARLISLIQSGPCRRTVDCLSRYWPRPWLFMTSLAATARANGLFDRSPGPEERSRLIWDFARQQTVWQNSEQDRCMLLDLLRIDYIGHGQKDRPAWMHFWEDGRDRAGKSLVQAVRQAASSDLGCAPDRKWLAERITFDWKHYLERGDLVPGDWLLAYDRTSPAGEPAWASPAGRFIASPAGMRYTGP